MSEDSRTLWVGNLDPKVTQHLLYELFLQSGPIDRLIFPTDGEGENKRHKGQAYIVFHHAETVQYATQILDGSSLFSIPLTMKARNLPTIYKSSSPTGGNSFQGNKGRFDNSALRTGFNKATTWHGQSDLMPRGRGGFRGRGGASSVAQNAGYNTGYNNYNNQVNTGYWSGEQQTTGSNQTSYSTSNNSLDERRQKLLQQQNLTLDAHRQGQQGNVSTQVYGVTQQQQPSDQQQTQGVWANNSYSTGSWNNSSSDASSYTGYTTDQYGNWYQQQ